MDTFSSEVELGYPQGTGRRVLIVDNDVDSCETMAVLLTHFGFEAGIAFSGKEALEVAESFRPDMILLDIDLPDVRGLEVAKTLLNHPTLIAKIVAVSDDLKFGQDAGFDAHLIKPANPEAIKELLTTLIPST